MIETELVSKRYRKFQKLKEINNLIEKWVKDVSSYCIIEETQMTAHEWDDHSFRKCQLTPAEPEWGTISHALSW